MQNKTNTLYIHRKTKKLLYVEMEKVEDKILIRVSNTDDGIKLKSPATDDPVIDSLPVTRGDLIKDSLAIMKHFKSYEYKVVNTISSNKKGLRFS
ncbi:MAG TPA: hypothetical protein VIM07_02710 [Chitinophagaceae bacterium]